MNSSETILTCSITGLPFGRIILDPCANGSQPWISAFNQSILHHPIFSLTIPKQLALFRNNLERSLTDNPVDDSLEISFVSLIHSLHLLTFPEIHNPILPSRTTVKDTGFKLITVVRYHIARPSFKFPKFSVNSLNNNEKLENIGDYLSTLIELTIAADKKAPAFDEEERSILQSQAIASIRRPEKISKKSLWKWCENHIASSEWKKDLENLRSLFFSTDKEIRKMDREDLEYLLTTLESVLPLGTPLLFEVRKHCEQMLTSWEDHFKDFRVVDTVAELWSKIPEPVAVPAKTWNYPAPEPSAPMNEPIAADYPSRAGFIVALAKFRLSNNR